MNAIKEAFALDMTAEFLTSLEKVRHGLVSAFRSAYDEELRLKKRFHQHILESETPTPSSSEAWAKKHLESETFMQLCRVAVIRELLEGSLNRIDIGGDYGGDDFEFRKKLINRWIKQRSKPSTISEEV